MTPKSPSRFQSSRILGAASLALWIATAPILAGCGPEQGGDMEEHVAHSNAAIYGGTRDVDPSGNPSVVAIKIGSGSALELCSGTLIADNVVLTARHCVSQVVSAAVVCDENGQSGNGAQLGEDRIPSTLQIYRGITPNLDGVSEAKGKAIFHPTGDVVCNTDIALIVLDRKMTGVSPLRVRLRATTGKGDLMRSVGYGLNDRGLPIGTRLRKDGVAILAVGKTISSSSTPLAANEFETGISICQGDSGGPAISADTGAVIGVVSRGGECAASFGHVYTSTASFSALFDRAFATAGGAPVEESQASEGDTTPATDADPTTTPGTEPQKSIGRSRAATDSGGCAISSSSRTQTRFGGLMLAALALLGIARSRRARSRA